MKTDIADRWIAELRSGKYKQGTGRLNRNGSFCCLGVLCEMVAVEAGVKVTQDIYEPECVRYDEEVAGVPEKIMRYADIKDTLGSYGSSNLLSKDNDIFGASFTEIADIIEAHKENL